MTPRRENRSDAEMTKESKARRRTLDDLTQEMIAADAGFKQAWDALEAKRKIVASLLRLRAKADFTQKELAERAGWQQSFVCRRESFPREGERSDEGRVGKEGVSTGRLRGQPD